MLLKSTDSLFESRKVESEIVLECIGTSGWTATQDFGTIAYISNVLSTPTNMHNKRRHTLFGKNVMTMSKRHLTIVGVGLSLVALILLLIAIRPGDQAVNGTHADNATERITIRLPRRDVTRCGCSDS